MNWFVRTFISSIGKKLMMSVTGLCFCGFLVVHLIGNLTLYGGKDLFLSYVDHLHALGYLITAAELSLVFSALIHIVMGLLLFYQNLRARPIRYSVKKNAGGRTIGSITAPYTGIIILIFIIIHLLTFRFVDKATTNNFIIISNTFAQSGYILFYIFAVIVVAIHVSHGLWSGFQTLGLNHPKYMPLIRGIGIVFSLIIGVGFGLIPIYISVIS